VIGLAVSAAIVLCGPVLGADGSSAAGSTRPEDVARLIRQLQARELAERDGAERELAKLGAEILPLLPRIDERTPAEVAERVARVQQQLLIEQALSAAAPTTVTLKGADLPLSDVLASISRQTGNPITDHRAAFGEPRTDPRLAVDFDKTPYWQALDQVLDQAGVTLYPFTGRRGAFVISRPADALPRAARASLAGAFRLSPVRFEARRDLRNNREQSLKFFFEVAWEPRLQPIAIMQPLARASAVGDDGDSIAVSNARAQSEVMIREGISAAELEIPLELPPRRVTHIRTLKGQLTALVPGPRHDFRFASLPLAAASGASRRVEQRQAGATVFVDSLRKNNDVWEVCLRVKFDAPANALESHRGWILENQALFETTDGRRIEPGGFEQTRQARDEIGIKFFFELDQDPSKLVFVYRTPITILSMNLDYEFRDLELP
jgi:hypothetical protein